MIFHFDGAKEFDNQSDLKFICEKREIHGDLVEFLQKHLERDQFIK
jgi:hypothetical protein